MGWDLVLDMASRQFGVVTRAQCLRAGLSPAAISRRLLNGQLMKVHNGVYRVSGAPVTWKQRLLAAVYWAGEHAVASGRSAAVLHKFPEIHEAPIEVSGRRKMRPTDGVLYHRIQGLAPADVCDVNGIATTTPARTVVDLAGRIRAAVLGRIIDDLLRRRLLTLEELAASVDRAGRTAKGRRLVIHALKTREGKGGPPHSASERRLYRLIVGSRLPVPTRQFRIRVGSRDAYPDCAYPEFMIAIEADSRAWHGSESARKRDADRDRRLKSLGWKVLRFSWEEIYFHPDFVVSEIRKALLERGALAF